MIKPEILSPIQDFTSLHAAIDAGADAVYFGIRGFNMRHGAKNFSVIDLSKISRLCHENKVKAYLALNTIIYEAELKKVFNILDKAKKVKIDAVIAWDLAVINYAKKIGLDIHLSTQAGVANSSSAEVYNKLGVKRIVLARECTLADIKNIKKKLKNKVALEVFIHGAMCVSVSGRCFMSEHFFGASANRGACTQPCRRKYLIKQIDGDQEMEIGEDYVLSPKDLCTLLFLEKLLTVGISSLKIEGRNRSPEYVFTTTKVYREAVDEYFKIKGKAGWQKEWTKKKEIWLAELKKVYHRGFGEGFYLGRPISQWNHSYGSVATQKKIHLGEVVHFYDKIMVAEIKIKAAKKLKIKDEIIIQGPTTGVVRQKVVSLEKDHQPIKQAGQGDAIAIKMEKKVRPGDIVYKIYNVS
jgi:putative protease